MIAYRAVCDCGWSSDHTTRAAADTALDRQTSRHYCGRCCRPVRDRRTPPDGRPARSGRGLCGACYDLARHNGTLHDYPTQVWPADLLLDEWTWLRDQGHTWRQAADRLGITHATFERALERAVARGDPRGARSLTRRRQAGAA